MIREEKVVHPEGHTEYRYFGTWRYELPGGKVAEFVDVDLAPYGNRIPNIYGEPCIRTAAR